MMMKRPSLSPDFWIGALTTLGFVALNHVWKLTRGSASLKRVQEVANRPVAHAGDDDKITIWGDDEATEESCESGVSDFSPFVNRVEAYLRLIKQPYVKATTLDMKENPRHKIPFANVQGIMVDDSSRIIEAIQQKFNIEEQVTEEQQLTGHLIRVVLFQSLHFVMAFVAFDTEKGRAYISKMLQDMPLPAILRPLIGSMLWKKEHANLCGQGFGRHPEEEIFQKGHDDICAIGQVLGNNKCILGTDEPTSCDTDVCAFMCLVFKEEVVAMADFVASAKKANPNLVSCVERMKKIPHPQHVMMHSLLVCENTHWRKVQPSAWSPCDSNLERGHQHNTRIET